MKRSPGWLAAVLAALSAPAESSAQAAIHIAAGVTVPTGEYSEYAKSGWITQAGYSAPVGEAGLALGGEVFFGRNNHEPPPDENKSYLYGATGIVRYAYGDTDEVYPFVFGMAGLLAESFRSDAQPGLNGSAAKLAVGAGAGVGFPAGDMTGYVNAWFLNGFGSEADTRLFGVTTGLRLPLDGF